MKKKQSRQIETESAVHRNERIGRELAALKLGIPVSKWRKRGVVRDTINSPDINVPDYKCRNDASDIWDEDYHSVSDTFRRNIPDAYFITHAGDSMSHQWNRRCHHLCLVEIVTSNDVSESKLREYGWIWDEFWCSNAWELHAYIVNTNSMTVSYIDLQDWYDRAITHNRLSNPR